MDTVLLASNNQGKIREFSQLLSPLGYAVKSQRDAGITDEVEETGFTFIENALLKARHAAKIWDGPCLADDSGLCVPTLKGAPGIYSARYAGPGASDTDNCQKLLEALQDSPRPVAAFFYCAIVWLAHADDPTPIFATAAWQGEIATAPSGEQGFGYDPIFYVPLEQCTSSELDAAQKNQLSHRGQALHKLVNKLRHLHSAVSSNTL